MLGTLAISVMVAAVLVTAWYLLFSRYNRKRSIEVLRWLESALGTQGQLVSVQWLTPSRFFVPLRLKSAAFQRASVLVELAPRELPFHWLLSRWRRQKDSAVICADLEAAPTMNLDLYGHRWSARTQRRLPMDINRWTVDQPIPLVLTSRGDWELTAMMNSLLTTPHRDFLELNIRRHSPHVRARVALETLAPDSPSRSHVFRVLGELAAGASTSRP
ncbi:MAG TPA: hypothetical protein VL382_08990 [Terriglobales bacterium]|nr:hypothetical protein [Terriglobales bacterium]